MLLTEEATPPSFWSWREQLELPYSLLQRTVCETNSTKTTDTFSLRKCPSTATLYGGYCALCLFFFPSALIPGGTPLSPNPIPLSPRYLQAMLKTGELFFFFFTLKFKKKSVAKKAAVSSVQNALDSLFPSLNSWKVTPNLGCSSWQERKTAITTGLEIYTSLNSTGLSPSVLSIHHQSE